MTFELADIRFAFILMGAIVMAALLVVIVFLLDEIKRLR